MTVVRQRIYEKPRIGLHAAIFDSYSEKVIESKKLLRLVFVLDQKDASGEFIEVSCLASPTLSKRSKLTQVVLALNAGLLPESVDLDLLLNRECQVVIGIKPNGWAEIASFLAPAPPPPATAPRANVVPILGKPQTFTLGPTEAR